MPKASHALQTMFIDVVGAAGSTGVFATESNPHGTELLITDSVLRITTGSTGASTLDIGIAANATTSNDGIIDGLSGATAGLLSTRGTNGRKEVVWPAGSSLNIAEASGDVAGLVAQLVITYTRTTP